jgi:hypothetical protein
MKNGVTREKVVAFAGKGVRAFLGLGGEVSLASAETAKTASFLAAGRLLYGLGDWATAAGLGAFSFWMQARGSGNDVVFIGTLAYDLVVAAIFFQLSDMTGCDFTLGRSWRRLADMFSGNSLPGRLFAGLLLIGISVRAILWEGPEVICFLFREELGKTSRVWAALIALSAIQACFGTWLYTTGYGLWSGLGAPFNSWWFVLLGGVATFAAFALAAFLVARLWNLLSIVFGKFFR